MRTFIKVFLLIFCVAPSVYVENALAFVNLDQATSRVIQKNNGTVLGARTEILDDREIHIIKVLTEDGRIQIIKVDAETGKALK